MPTTRDLDAELDERLQRYAASGMSRAGMLAQLNLAGYPTDKLRERFPEMSDVAFGITTPTSDPSQQGRAATLQRPILLAGRTRLPRTRLRGRLAPSRSAGPSAPASVSPRNTATTELTRATREAEEGGGISFHYVPLIQCSFPHADPGDAHSFTRKNGWLELTLGTTRPETGLPYGVPARLLTIYAASEAVRTKSPEIFLGTSVHDFLRRLDVPITRGDRGSLARLREPAAEAHSLHAHHRREHQGRHGSHRAAHPPGFVCRGSALVVGRRTRSGAGLIARTLERAVSFDPRSLGAALDQRDQVAAQEPDGPRRVRLARAPLVQSFEAEHRDVAAALRAVRPRLLGAALLPSFFIDSSNESRLVYPEAKLKVADAGVILLPSRPHTARALNKA